MIKSNNASCTITLNIYDIHDGNYWLHDLGLGVYHTGVEVSLVGSVNISAEYSFSCDGIIRSKPKLNVFGKLRGSSNLGIFEGSLFSLHNQILQLGFFRFAPGKYDLLTNNCNHFSDAVVFALLQMSIPSWINRLADMSSPFISSSALIPTPEPSIELLPPDLDNTVRHKDIQSSASRHSKEEGKIGVDTDEDNDDEDDDSADDDDHPISLIPTKSNRRNDEAECISSKWLCGLMQY